MTTIADRVAGPPLAGPTDAIARDAAEAAAASLPAISFPVGEERELRLDLFRGLALWLIFIDLLPRNLLTWFTIRNYGFSDATEIFIFISGYTAAFVYGRAMLQSGVVVATARILRRGWPIFVAPVFLFTIFFLGNFLRRHQFREPAILGRNGHHGFSQAAGRHDRPGAALEIPSRQHGRAAALYRADAFSPADPVGDEVESRRDAGAVGPALCHHLAIRSVSDGLSERLLGLTSAGLAVAVRVRRMVRAGRRPANVADSFVAGHDVDFVCLPVRGVLRHADLVSAAAQSSDAAPGGAMDGPPRQARSRRAAVRTLPGAGGRYRTLPAEGLARIEIALAAAAGP